MTLPPDVRKGPGTDSEAPAEARIHHQADPVSTVDDSAALSSLADAHAVVVELPDDKVRRRIYLSLHSAERAVTRARATGQRAELYLCKIVPIGGDVR